MTVVVEGWCGFALVHSVRQIVRRDGMRAVPYGCGAYMKKGGSFEPPLRGIRIYLAQRYRKVTTWALLQMLETPKVPSPMPLVMPFSTAHMTGAK